MKQVKKVRFGRKWLAFLLAMLMLAGCFSFSGMAQAADDSARIVDEATHTAWEAELGDDVTTTEQAGRIWVDKSVFDADVELKPSEIDIHRTKQDAFLVALSALASNKSIVGQDVIPTDVVFVLDVSSSMNSAAIASLVSAANEVIRNLMAMNPDNRVGVVQFGSTSQALMPLDHYTAGNNQTYLSAARSDIEVANGVRNSNGQQPQENPSGNPGDGTNMQRGIYHAYELLENAETTTDSGDDRLPIVVVMGDGAPLHSNVAYDQVPNIDQHGIDINKDAMHFTTELTAAWIKEKVREHYQVRIPLFYTLGLGEGATDGGAVLDPADQSTDHYWEQFSGLETNKTMEISDDYGVEKVIITKKDDTPLSKDYVDKFFEAEDASALADAFNSILGEIYIQSKYYPTDVEYGQGSDLSGYITFEDEIGPYMEVKAINGLVANSRDNSGKVVSTHYTGAAFAEQMEWLVAHLPGGYPGTPPENPTPEQEKAMEYAQQFFESVCTRMGLTGQTAVTFIEGVFEAKFNPEDMPDNKYSYGHTMKWYADEKGAYIDLWEENEPVPENAATLNTSYFYTGAMDLIVEEGAEVSTDLMHITVRVEQPLGEGGNPDSTQNQKILWKIPASLVPVVEYKITIAGDQLEGADEVEDVERRAAYPIRLFYEVGLRQDVTPSNVAEKVGASYPYRTAAGAYRFYTNAWDQETGAAKTIATFDPSTDNEFYYYHENTFVWDANGNIYQGVSKPTGDAYCYQKVTFPTQITDGKEITRKNEPISPLALEQARQDEAGNWYIPKGTPKRQQEIREISKEQNQTGSAPHVLKPEIHPYGDEGDPSHPTVGTLGQLHIDAKLGNNGVITITPERNELRVTKQVAGKGAPPGKDFTFTIQWESNAPLAPEILTATVMDAEGKPTGEPLSVPQGENVSFKLKDGWSMVLPNLPGGATYTVTETPAEHYTTSFTGADTSADSSASGTITEHATNEKDAITCTNTYQKPVENVSFTFTKVDGVHQNPLQGAEFQMYRLTCTDSSHNHSQQRIEQELADGQLKNCWVPVTAGEQAPETVVFSSDQDGTVTIPGLTPGDTYRLVETKAPGGYTLPAGEWQFTVDDKGKIPASDDVPTITTVGRQPPAIEVDDDGGYRLSNYKPGDVPLTGGRGLEWVVLSGALLLTGGAAMLFFYSRSARKRRQS